MESSSQATVIARWLGGLRAGALPSNAQLYQGLHILASKLDAISTASSSGSPDPSSGTDAAARAHPVLNPKTKELLDELSGAARDGARWLYGGKTRGNAEERREELLVDVSDKSEDKESAPKGNEREQIQRLLWLVRSASVDVDIDVDVPPARDALEAAKSAARITRDEGASAIGALWTLATVVGVAEAQRLFVLAIAKARTRAAQRAEQIAHVAENAAEAVKPEQSPDEVEEVEEIPKLDEALKDAAAAGKQAIKEAVGKGESDTSMPEKEEWKDIIARSTERMLRASREDPKVQEALQTLLDLTSAWGTRLDELSEKLKNGGPSVDVKEGLAALKNSHVDASLDASPAMIGALGAAREVLEGLAGGTSLSPTTRAWERLVRDAQEDSGLRTWFREAGTTLRACVNTGEEEALSVEEAQEKLKELFANLQELLSQTPAIKEDLSALFDALSDFSEALRTEPSLQAIQRRLARSAGMVRGALAMGIKGLASEAGSVVRDIVSRVIPSLAEVFASVPLPRVEFTSDMADAVVEDVVIPTINLIPDDIRFSAQNDYHYTRDRDYGSTSNVDSRFKLSLAGFRLGLKDISFYVEEKITAPSPTTCFGCCGCFPSSKEAWDSRTWCITQGPAAWLAYRESALLDVGFWKQGLKLEIDIEDAGQVAQRDTSAAHPPTNDMDEDRRESFFTVKNVSVDAGAFDFKMRNSHHWMLNFLFRPVARPVVKLVISRVVAALVQDAFEKTDKALCDIHKRATRLAQDRAGWGGKAAGAGVPEVEAAWMDYARVLMNSEAGKSGARKRKERKEKQKLEREKKETEEQREREREEQFEEREEMERHEEHPRTEQLKPTQVMKFTPTSLIKTDAAGSYALSVGVAPKLLPPHKRGPTTAHTALRDDIVNKNYRALAKRPVDRGRQAWDEADPIAKLLEARDAAQQGVEQVREVRQGVRVSAQDGREQVEASDKQSKHGWRSELFDL